MSEVRRPFLYALVCLSLLLTTPVAARLGGGGSSSSSSSSRSSSSSSYSSASNGSQVSALPLLMMLCFLYAIGFNIVARTHRLGTATDVDECFSWAIFREFASLLYVRALQEAGEDFPVSGDRLEPKVRKSLRKRFKQAVTRVTVSSIRPGFIWNYGGKQFIYVTIKANYWQGKKSFASEERWTFSRQSGTLSPDPEALVCSTSQDGASSSTLKSAQWQVSDVTLFRNVNFRWQPSSPDDQVAQLVTHPELRARQEAFLTRYPEFSLEAFNSHVEQAFYHLQKAWSDGDLKALRPYETDALYQMHGFWLDYYKSQGQRNCLDEVKLLSAEISNIVHDRYYDAITVHVVASMIDIILDEDGKVLYGDRERYVNFGEYWTFIRRAGSPEKLVEQGCCPSCGQELSGIRLSGECEHCGNLLTLGNFGWVLSCIEQEYGYYPVG